MKNRILLVFLAVLLVVSLAALAACKAEEAPPVEEEEEAPPVEEVWEWPEKLIIVAFSPGAIDYTIGVSWASPMAEDTGMKIRVVSEDSDRLRMLWIKEGRFHLSTGEAMFHTIEAVGPYATRDGGPYQARILYPMYRSENSYAVRGDSGIKTPYDLKGKRLIYFTFAGEFARQVFLALLAWGNLTEDDVTWVPCDSLDASTRFLIEGKGDVSVGCPESPRWYEVEAAPHGLAWIELNAQEDREGAKRFVEVLPMFSFAPLTAGVESSLGVWGIISNANYNCSVDYLDPELGYHIVKWLDENYDKYKDAHPLLKWMTIDTLLYVSENDYMPLHEGAVKYLKEKGLWTDKHQARWQYNVDLVTSYVEAYAKAIDMSDEKGIRVNPENEEWIELWENYKKELGLPRFRAFAGLD